jgi:hypothetical protein
MNPHSLISSGQREEVEQYSIFDRRGATSLWNLLQRKGVMDTGSLIQKAANRPPLLFLLIVCGQESPFVAVTSP